MEMETKKFKIGDKFSYADIFTGGILSFSVTSRTETEIICDCCDNEIDGTHHREQTFEILTDDKGNERILLWEYLNHRGYLHAFEMSTETEDEYEEYDSYDLEDPCYGCSRYDGGYNCKHCKYGDDGRYESPFDVYTPSELGLSVSWR